MLHPFTFASFFLVVFASIVSLPATENEQEAENERRLAVIQEAAEGYTLYGDRERKTELKRIEKPLLRFDDPVTLSTQGCVYLWIDAVKRPIAIASIYFQADGARIDEFQSLTSADVSAEFMGGVVWQPGVAGIEWAGLPDAGEVPDTKALRLGKMRDFAKQFTAVVSDSRAGRQELRLLPQPMYRYEAAEQGIVDGALFSYAKGTNPEVLLLLQAVSQDDRTEWRYAFCRMTSRECEVSRDARVFWKNDRIRFPQGIDEPYFNRATR